MFRENDIKVVRGGGSTIVVIAEDRTTSSVTASMKPGEPVKLQSSGANYVIPVADGDPEIGTDEFIGIVRKESTELSVTTQGTVEVIQMIPVKTLLRGKATTAGNIDTQAKLNALLLDWVTFDVTGLATTNGIFTINESEGDDPNVHGLCIIQGDINDGTLDVIVHGLSSQAAPNY